jgi:hypothetical protein
MRECQVARLDDLIPKRYPATADLRSGIRVDERRTYRLPLRVSNPVCSEQLTFEPARPNLAGPYLDGEREAAVGEVMRRVLVVPSKIRLISGCDSTAGETM